MIVKLAIILFMISMGIVLFLSLNGKEFIKLDLNLINEKNVVFWHVYKSNMILICKIIFLGVTTISLYSNFSYIQNVFSIGIIANGLVNEGYGRLAAKMIPHGVIEFIGISIAVSTVIWVWIFIIKNIVKIIKCEVSVKDVIKKIVGTMIAFLMVCSVVFAVAGIIEVMVSHYKVI